MKYLCILIIPLLLTISCVQKKNAEPCDLPAKGYAPISEVEEIDYSQMEYYQQLPIEDETPSQEPTDVKEKWSRQLDAFELQGDVHTVKYDSVYLKYDRAGNLEFFGFNDSINLYNDTDNKGIYNQLKKWGNGVLEFEAVSQDASLDYIEGPMMVFAFWDYGKKEQLRYTVKLIKKRPDSLSTEERRATGQRERKIVYSVQLVTKRPGVMELEDLNYSNYKYDDYGNWIERKVKSDESPTKIEKRTITYYSNEE